MKDVNIRTVVENDVSKCYEIESLAYEGDEAATKEKIAKRVSLYPQGFIVLETEQRIAGFINSGCAYDVVMSDEEFKELIGHDPDAPNVVIMSVVVHPDFQGLGYSALLMSAFVDRMQKLGKKAIYLMCKERHIGLYEKLGFSYVKLSDSDHGGMSWHEMMMEL